MRRLLYTLTLALVLLAADGEQGQGQAGVTPDVTERYSGGTSYSIHTAGTPNEANNGAGNSARSRRE